ncbi:unnamed protein product [Angiostrongylus costaricensis]|uniref:Transposase n=1 Tax=Angiostrongylus costaricensis TaxID=334426 RepID=A0A0R3PEL2_ANGCS|nr:unnamed protein product [Angiostrongylus costaricensis]
MVEDGHHSYSLRGQLEVKDDSKDLSTSGHSRGRTGTESVDAGKMRTYIGRVAIVRKAVENPFRTSVSYTPSAL